MFKALKGLVLIFLAQINDDLTLADLILNF